jgi:inner membrane protein
MDPVTHLAAGVALSQLVPGPSRVWAAAAGVFFAVLPDLDYVLALHDRLSYLRHHRGFSHSLVALPLFALAGALLARWVGGPRWFRPVLLIGLLVLASHLFLDLATSYGTQILSPFTRNKYTLDWLFIIDPYLTGLLLVAAVALWWPARGRSVGLICLALAAGYIVVCGFYHQRAVGLARQIYHNLNPQATVAALPQPFSPRRWHLLAATPGEAFQTFVTLPLWPFGTAPPSPPVVPVKASSVGTLAAPVASYEPPGNLTIHRWQAAFTPPATLSREARRLLEVYQEFARFPLPVANRGDENSIRDLFWVDLRFSLPGRHFPFMLYLRLDPRGGLRSWSLGAGQPQPPSVPSQDVLK